MIKKNQNVLDGLIIKKEKNSFHLDVKKEKTRIYFDSETAFSKMKFSFSDSESKKFKQISETKTKWADFKKGDDVSVAIDKQDNKFIALTVKKIIVVEK